VTGTAGLAFAFNKGSASDIRQAILEGAKRRGKLIEVRPDGTPVYLLDAFETLRVTAERSHAPLCGNRVYQLVPGSIVVQRKDPAGGGFSEEYLPGALGASGTVAMWAEHGGRRLFVWDAGIADGVYVLEHNGASFSLFAGDPWTLSGSDSVFHYNRWRDGVSHSGRDVVSVRPGAERESSKVRITTGGTTREIGLIPKNDGSSAPQVYRQFEACPADVLSSPAQCVGPYEWFDGDTISVGTFERHDAPMAEFSAFGDSVFIAVENASVTRTLASDWTVYAPGAVVPFECRFSTGGVPGTVGGAWLNSGRMRCRIPQTSVTQRGSKMWRLPANGTGSTIAQEVTSVSADVAGRQIYRFKLPEGNRELLLAVGTPIDNINTMPNNCRMEWRERRLNAKTFEMPSLAACQYGMQREGGSFLRSATSSSAATMLVRGRPMDLRRSAPAPSSR